jgi:hypothetical protein
VAAGTTRVGNCVDCTVYSYSHCGAPIVYGDTRNLLMGPHNAGYTELPNQLQQAGLNLQVSDLHLRIHNFTSPQLMHVPKQSINF